MVTFTAKILNGKFHFLRSTLLAPVAKTLIFSPFLAMLLVLY